MIFKINQRVEIIRNWKLLALEAIRIIHAMSGTGFTKPLTLDLDQRLENFTSVKDHVESVLGFMGPVKSFVTTYLCHHSQ